MDNTTIDYYPIYQRPQPVTYPELALCVIVPLIIVLLRHAGPLDRPVLPRGSPNLWEAYHWPVIGSVLRFYNRRRDMVVEGTQTTPNGTFSFYVGRNHIINLGGLDGRKTFFETRDFSLSAGFAELLAGSVSPEDARDDYGAAFFIKCVSALSTTEMLARRLPMLTRDAESFCDVLSVQRSSTFDSHWRVTDVTKSVHTLLYKLTQRSIGVTEFAQDDMLRWTLSMFEKLERSPSLAHIVCPWLVTPSSIIRSYAGARIRKAILKIINKRIETGNIESDGLQYVYDQGGNADKVIQFTFGGLSSSITTTGAAVTWLTAFLADNLECREKCRDEVNVALSKYRRSPKQSSNDILATLPLQAWESDFPILLSCLQETLRIISTGTFFRKNISGYDIPIGSSDVVVPDGSYAAYLPDNMHMNPRLYENPLTFEPARFSNPAGLENNEPHTFLGWGSGCHLCPGMRLAKLEINLVLVYMLANFQFELSDKQGRQRVGSIPSVDRNKLRPERSRMPIYIRYKTYQGNIDEA